MVSDSADVTSSWRSFQVCGQATGKARLPTVDSLLADRHYTRRLMPTERSDRRLGRSCKMAEVYPGASPWVTLYVKAAILNSILSGTRKAQPMEAGQRVGDRIAADTSSDIPYAVQVSTSNLYSLGDLRSPQTCSRESGEAVTLGCVWGEWMIPFKTKTCGVNGVAYIFHPIPPIIYVSYYNWHSVKFSFQLSSKVSVETSTRVWS